MFNNKAVRRAATEVSVLSRWCVSPVALHQASDVRPGWLMRWWTMVIARVLDGYDPTWKEAWRTHGGLKLGTRRRRREDRVGEYFLGGAGPGDLAPPKEQPETEAVPPSAEILELWSKVEKQIADLVVERRELCGASLTTMRGNHRLELLGRCDRRKGHPGPHRHHSQGEWVNVPPEAIDIL